MSSLVERVLIELARLAGEDGCAVPQIASPQARRAAEQLVAAVGPTRVEPQPAITAAPDPGARRREQLAEQMRARRPHLEALRARQAMTAPTVLAQTVVIDPVPAEQPPPAEPQRRYKGWS